MPPSPERGVWPADVVDDRDPFVDEDDGWFTVDRRHPARDPYGYDDDPRYGTTDGAYPHVDPWVADSPGMNHVPAPRSTAGAGGTLSTDGVDEFDRVASHGPEADPLPRGYDDYFDDDEDDLDEVEATSEATRNALEWAVVLVGAVLVALILRASLFQAFWIPSESMETTLLTNDRVLVNKVSYRLHEINRGDIVVFERPVQEPGEIRDLIKRVIALPGETVEATEGSVYINGQRLVEPYLDPGVTTTDFPPTVVPEGEIFVMGDNRGNSQDSRAFGTVPEERVVGRAFVLFWPIGRVGSL